MGEVILITEVADLGKPSHIRLCRADEHLFCNSVKDVARKTGYHPKNGQLLEMEGCFSWQYTCQKEDNRVGSVGMELEQFLNGFFDM